MKRLTAFGHPIHPALTDFPLALLPAALVFDAAGLWLDPRAYVGGYLCVLLGVLLSAPTALSGLLDLVAIPKQQEAAADLAIWHLCAALTGVGLFVGSLVARPRMAAPAPGRVWLVLGLELAGTASLLAAGWLGGHLVFHHGLGVDRPDPDR